MIGAASTNGRCISIMIIRLSNSYLFDIWAFEGFNTEHSRNYFPCLVRYTVTHSVVALIYLLIKVPLSNALERIIATEHQIKNDAERPHISLESVIFFLLNYLWSHIRRSPAEDLLFGVLRSANTKSEVDQFDIVSFIYKYVL